MPEFVIKDRTYRTARMDAFSQFHVARRLLPILAGIPKMLGVTADQLFGDFRGALSNIAGNLGAINLDAIAETFAKLPNEDCEYVFNACLEACDIKDRKGGGWSRLRLNGVTMFDHLTMTELLGISVNVVRENISDFLPEIAPTSPVPETAAK